MNEVRFVLDSNMLVSAAMFKDSIARQAFEKVALEGSIVMSEPVLAELQDVFSRSRFDKYLSPHLREKLLANLRTVVKMVEITAAVTLCRDPKDDKFLELALSGSASYIITSDKDLLVLHPFEEIKILSPTDFLSSIQ